MTAPEIPVEPPVYEMSIGAFITGVEPQVEIPAEAVEAGNDWYENDAPESCDHWPPLIRPEWPELCGDCKWRGMLAAAAPAIRAAARAETLAEVDAALRRLAAQRKARGSFAAAARMKSIADYLRDVRGDAAREEGT